MYCKTKKENYERKIIDLQETIAQEQSISNENDYDAAISMYKSIAPVKIIKADGENINGMIAFGTPGTTSFFKYSNNGDNSNE